MEIFVINLKHRKDKLEKFLANLPSILSNEKIKIFEAIDGSSIYGSESDRTTRVEKPSKQRQPNKERRLH